MKIISGNPPSTGDHHGCPFRHFSQGNLESKLYSERLGAVQVNEIMNLVRDRHYQVACTRYFEVTHSQYGEKSKIDTVEHPNQYYEASRRLAKESQDDSGDAMEVDR